MPASENVKFREEFDKVSYSIPIHILTLISILTYIIKEYTDVQLTAYLSSLTKTINALNDVRINYDSQDFFFFVYLTPHSS